eukprot:17939-Heterococcus_DN1.PRE.4
MVVSYVRDNAVMARDVLVAVLICLKQQLVISILLSDAVTSLTAVKCVTERSLQPVMIDVSTLYVLLFAQLQSNTNCEGAVVLRCCGVLVMLDYTSCDVVLHTLAACQ